MTYLPEHFAQTDAADIEAFLNANPFGTLVVNLNGELWPTPIPLIFQPDHGEFGRFIAHVSIQNDMWRADPNQDVLAIFHGPNTYITPNWYATKRETHKVVPTWNYATVHAWGKMTVHHDEKFKRMAVGLLTKVHEATNEQPWKMGDAPQDYLVEQLDGIVGLSIDITRIKAKWKLNQNRTEADRAGVIVGLEVRDTGDDQAIRNLMIKAKKP